MVSSILALSVTKARLARCESVLERRRKLMTRKAEWNTR